MGKSWVRNLLQPPPPPPLQDKVKRFTPLLVKSENLLYPASGMVKTSSTCVKDRHQWSVAIIEKESQTTDNQSAVQYQTCWICYKQISRAKNWLSAADSSAGHTKIAEWVWQLA